MIIFHSSINIGDNIETFNFFKKQKNEGENLGVSTLRVDQIFSTIPMYQIIDSLPKFLEFSKKNNYYEGRGEYWRENVEIIPKFFWLSSEYIDNNYKFNNALGVHWQTSYQKWAVHPGGMRYNVIKLFSKQDYLQCITFNTQGFDHNFDIIFHKYHDLENYVNNKDLHLVLVPDQGSLIPHVAVENNSIFKMTHKYFNYLKNFFMITLIETNSDSELIKEINSCNRPFKRRLVKVIFKDTDTPEDVFKSLIYLIKGKNYEPEKYKIKYD